MILWFFESVEITTILLRYIDLILCVCEYFSLSVTNCLSIHKYKVSFMETSMNIKAKTHCILNFAYKKNVHSTYTHTLGTRIWSLKPELGKIAKNKLCYSISLYFIIMLLLSWWWSPFPRLMTAFHQQKKVRHYIESHFKIIFNRQFSEWKSMDMLFILGH